MRTRFDVRVVRFLILDELEGVWLADDFRALLDAMEFGDSSNVDGDELREMCLMSLQDLGTSCLRERQVRHSRSRLEPPTHR